MRTPTGPLARVLPRDPGERLGAAVAAAAGLSWGWSRTAEYPDRFLLPLLRDVWPVQLATLAGLALGTAAVAAALFLPVLLARRLGEPAPSRPRPSGTALFLAGLLALSAATRLSFWPELPGAVWTDVTYAIHAAASAGRFLWPWDAMPLVPPEVGGSKVLLFGLFVDFVRGLLHAAPDRVVAALLVSALPGLLLPVALWALVRRVAGERAARLSALLLALSFPALVQARWGWVQQALILLQLLALERAARGLSAGRERALVTSGLLAGLSLHTYVASFPATAGLLAYLALVSWRRRSVRPVASFAAGLAIPAVLLALVYAVHPDSLGGRATEVSLLGAPAARGVAGLVANVVEHAGAFFFSVDPNTRHGLPGVPALGLAFSVLLPLGVSRARGEGWGVVAAGLLGSLAGALPTLRYLTPNTFRIGLALALGAAFAGAALAALRALPIGSEAFRSMLPVLLALAIGAAGYARFLRWGLLAPRPPQVSQVARAAGEFLAQAGPARVLLDPSLFSREDSPLVAAFWVRTRAPLEPLRLPRTGALGEATSARPPRAWLVTNRPPPGAPGLRFGPKGTPEGILYAVDLARWRARNAPGAPPPAPVSPSR